MADGKLPAPAAVTRAGGAARYGLLMRAGFALLAATIAGCGWTSTAPSCDESSALCQSALTVTVRSEGGQPFAPGTYSFEVTLDGARRDIECAVDGTTTGGSRCLEQSGPSSAAPVLHDLEVVAFKISLPPARRAVVAMREVCGSGGLHTQTFEPAYSCAGECRRAEVTMTIGAGFTICPDAGAPETRPP